MASHLWRLKLFPYLVKAEFNIQIPDIFKSSPAYRYQTSITHIKSVLFLSCYLMEIYNYAFRAAAKILVAAQQFFHFAV